MRSYSSCTVVERYLDVCVDRNEWRSESYSTTTLTTSYCALISCYSTADARCAAWRRAQTGGLTRVLAISPCCAHYTGGPADGRRRQRRPDKHRSVHVHSRDTARTVGHWIASCYSVVYLKKAFNDTASQCDDSDLKHHRTMTLQQLAWVPAGGPGPPCVWTVQKLFYVFCVSCLLNRSYNIFKVVPAVVFHCINDDIFWSLNCNCVSQSPMGESGHARSKDYRFILQAIFVLKRKLTSHWVLIRLWCGVIYVLRYFLSHPCPRRRRCRRVLVRVPESAPRRQASNMPVRRSIVLKIRSITDLTTPIQSSTGASAAWINSFCIDSLLQENHVVVHCVATVCMPCEVYGFEDPNR